MTNYMRKLYTKLYVNYQIINPLKYLIINSNSISLTETNVKTLFYLLMLINQSNTFIFFSIYSRYYSFLRLSSFFALFAIIWYFLPLELYCLARIYAEYTPFLLLLQVFFLQIGNDLFGPKKHFFRIFQAFWFFAID